MMYHHLNKPLPNGMRQRNNVSSSRGPRRAPLKFTRSSSSGSTGSSSSSSRSSSSSTASTKRSDASAVDRFRHRYFCTIGIIMNNTSSSFSTTGNTTTSCRRTAALRRVGIQQLSTRLLLRNDAPRGINVPLRCTKSSVITGSSVAAAGINVKVVKAEENGDATTHYHDDKKKLEQQQGQLSIKTKAHTNVAGAVDMNKKANKVTMESTEKKKASKCSVNFNETVIVIPIPTKDEYSDRIKSKLWTRKYEMMERIVRNELEFATEGCNWRTVCTEEEMYMYYYNINNNVEDDSAAIAGGSVAAKSSYELIHPVHFDLGEYTFGICGQVIKLSSDRLYNY